MPNRRSILIWLIVAAVTALAVWVVVASAADLTGLAYLQKHWLDEGPFEQRFVVLRRDPNSVIVLYDRTVILVPMGDGGFGWGCDLVDPPLSFQWTTYPTEINLITLARWQQQIYTRSRQ